MGGPAGVDDPAAGPRPDPKPAEVRHWVTEVLDALYAKFLLRDVVAKAVLGGIVLAAAAEPLMASLGRSFRWESMVFVGWVFASCCAWLVGIALQGAGERLGLTVSRYDGTRSVLGVWTAAVRGIEGTLQPTRCRRSSFALRRLSVLDSRRRSCVRACSDDARRLNERLVVLKEACGNASIAVVVTLAVLTATTGGTWSAPWPYLGAATSLALYEKHWRLAREQYALLRDEARAQGTGRSGLVPVRRRRASAPSSGRPRI